MGFLYSHMCTTPCVRDCHLVYKEDLLLSEDSFPNAFCIDWVIQVAFLLSPEDPPGNSLLLTGKVSQQVRKTIYEALRFDRWVV